MKQIILAICTTAILLFACNNEKKETPAGVDTAEAGKFPAPGEFHKMLARSNGTWTGQATMQFSPDAPLVDGGTSVLINTMAMNGLYQVSEIKGSPSGTGKPWTGLRITGFNNVRKVVTRAMIGDGEAAGGVSMEGTWDEATTSITMPFKRKNPTTGEERNLKEVYRIIDENTEVLEIYETDPKTKKEFKMLNVKWIRKK
jgi:hypothetical protein